MAKRTDATWEEALARAAGCRIVGIPRMIQVVDKDQAPVPGKFALLLQLEDHNEQVWILSLEPVPQVSAEMVEKDGTGALFVTAKAVLAISAQQLDEGDRPWAYDA